MPIGAHNKIPLTSAVLAAILAINTANAQVVCGATDAEKLQRLQSATSPLDLSAELLSAAGQQQPRSVAWLLERGAPIDGHDTTGVTALMAFILGVQRPPDELEKKLSDAYKKLPPWPCERETRDAERAILRALLARSPDLEARDAAGSTALLMAARVRRFDLANALHDAGAKIDAADATGETALLQAARQGRFDLVLAFHALGADINARDATGTTAIFFAPHDWLKRLVSAGADINAADAHGNTALHFSMTRLPGQQLLDYVETAISLGAHDSRNKRGDWASELPLDSISFLEIPRGLDKADAMRKRLKATRPSSGQ